MLDHTTRGGIKVTDVSPITSPTNPIGPLPSTGEQSRSSLTTIVARNSAFVLGSQAMLKVLAFMFNIYVVHRLGDVHFGQYSAVMAYVAIFAIFTDWGMAPYAVREIAEDHKRTSWLLPNIIAIRLAFSLIIVIVAPLSAHWLGQGREMVLGIFIASGGLLIYAFHGPLDSTLTARERLDYTATFTVTQQLVFWGLGVLLLINGMGFIGLIIASLSGVAVTAVLSAWVLFKLGVERLVLSVRRWPRLLLDALPFGVSGIAYVFMQRFDTVLLSFLLTDAAVGWYNAPYVLINMILVIAQSIAIAMYPSMVRDHKTAPESLHKVTRQAIKYLLIICLPITIGGTVLARRIILTLYPAEFVNSVPVLQLMLWALPCLFLLELLGRVAYTLHMERPAAKIDITNAGITVLLNLILIPTLGLVGGAWALIGGRVIRLVQYWRLIGNERLVGRRWGALLRVTLAAAVMGASVFFLGQTVFSTSIDSKIELLALIGAGAITYAVALIALGGIERRELVFMYHMALERWTKEDAR
jgi:O-antigen/teichoic acid export membrane protein